MAIGWPSVGSRMGRWWPGEPPEREACTPTYFTEPVPREGSWWFWIENEDEQRISEMGFVHTDKDPHTGKCQWAVIDFDIQNPDLIYIGRRLNIPVAG